jgi:hypothetical protein
MNGDALIATVRNCLQALGEDFSTKGFKALGFQLVQAGINVEK